MAIAVGSGVANPYGVAQELTSQVSLVGRASLDFGFGWRWSGGCTKCQQERPDADLIPIRKRRRCPEPFTLKICPILAVGVLQHGFTILEENSRVSTGHARRLEADRDIWIATNDVFAIGQNDFATVGEQPAPAPGPLAEVA